MKKTWENFMNLKIKYKLFITNLGIIIIMVILLGISSYLISRNLLTSASVKASKNSMEQLSTNLDYAISSIDDFVLIQAFDSNLNNYLKADLLMEDSKKSYDKEKWIQNFSYTFMNYKKMIKAVIIEDNFGNVYYNSYDFPDMKTSDIHQNLRSDKVLSMWGKTWWQPYSDDMIFASRVVFDRSNM